MEPGRQDDPAAADEDEAELAASKADMFRSAALAAERRARRLEAKLAEAKEREQALLSQIEALETSTSWRLTAPLRRATRHVQTFKALRAAVNALRKASPAEGTEGAKGAAARGAVAELAGDAETAAADTPGQKPRLWFYVGDTLDWLDHASTLTGVGRVSSELFLASQSATDVVFPCVLGNSASSLVPVAPGAVLDKLSPQLGRTAAAPVPAVQADAAGPRAGDHVFFTGLVWTPNFAELFQKLAGLGVRFTVLVFDIIPLERSVIWNRAEEQRFGAWLSTTLQTADTVFVSSTIIRDKILRWATLSRIELRCRIETIQYGSRPLPASAGPADIASDPSLSAVQAGNFVLSLGTIDQRKNQAFLCRLWQDLAGAEIGPELPQLVLVGRDDAGLGGAKSPFRDLIDAGRLLILEGASDPQVAALMRACRFSAFASTSEGYGLPVEESLQCGKLCLTSDLPEVREFAGDLPWYFPADDMAAARTLFLRAMTDARAVADAEARIRSGFKPRSWADALSTLIGEARATDRRPPAPLPSGRLKSDYPGAKRSDTKDVLANAARWCSEDDPDVSIVVVNRDDALLTLECVRQIWAHTDGHRYEVIIVDNGSGPRDRALLGSLPRGVRLLPLGSDRYAGETKNIGAEAARGRYLCLLGNDIFPQPGWLARLMDAMTRHPDAGAVGPVI